MNNWKENLLNRWESLSLRDKRIVASGSTVLVIFIFYLLIWAPISQQIEPLRSKISQNKKLLAWMQAADKKIQLVHKQTQSSSQLSSKSLLSLLQHEVNASLFSKNLIELKQIDNTTVQMSLKNVAFDNVMSWSIGLWQKYGLQIIRLNAKSEKERGTVTIEITWKA